MKTNPTDAEVIRAILAIQLAEKGIESAVSQFQAAQIGLGAALRAARKAKDVSLRTIAKHLKLSPPFISDCELGRRTLSDKHRVQYLEFLQPGRTLLIK
jgi:predicted transcriptional regulator